MRIVFVTHQYPPNYTTGTELYAKRLALRLRGAFGHDVRIFTFEPSYNGGDQLVRREETVDDGVPVTRVWAWPGLQPNFALSKFYNVFLGKAFGTYLDQVRPDVVHIFHTAFLGVTTIEEAFLREIPTVVNLMDFWFLCPTAQLLKTRTLEQCDGPDAFPCLECLSVGDVDFDKLLAFTRGEGFVPIRSEFATLGNGLRFASSSPYSQLASLAIRPAFMQQILLHADRIVSPSKTVRDRFVKSGYPQDRFDVVPYGVDPMPSYAFDKGSSPTLRFGFIGSINRPKGLHVLVDAFLKVKGDCSLDIYGDPMPFPLYSNDCFVAARQDPRVRIRGRMRPEHVATALRDIDVLVVPSLWSENTPFVVLEGRAAGVPIVASAVDGIAEIVRDHEEGRLFKPSDADDLARVMQELVDDRPQVARMSGRFASVRTLLDNARFFERMYEGLAALRRHAIEGVRR